MCSARIDIVLICVVLAEVIIKKKKKIKKKTFSMRSWWYIGFEGNSGVKSKGTRVE